jgi:hypothetical protein
MVDDPSERSSEEPQDAKGTEEQGSIWGREFNNPILLVFAILGSVAAAIGLAIFAGKNGLNAAYALIGAFLVLLFIVGAKVAGEKKIGVSAPFAAKFKAGLKTATLNALLLLVVSGIWLYRNQEREPARDKTLEKVQQMIDNRRAKEKADFAIQRSFGHVVEQKKAEIREAVSRCQKGDYPICASLGNAYLNGEMLLVDPFAQNQNIKKARAKAYFTKACKEGNIQAACKKLATLKDIPQLGPTIPMNPNP